jgi:Tol biopolymer transport system component
MTGLQPPLVFSAARRLTAVELCCRHRNALEVLGAPGSRPKLLDDWSDYVDPGSRTAAWSSTGSLIAYARVKGARTVKRNQTPEWEIAVIAPDGKHRRVLTGGVAIPYVAPALSPDGGSVLFCADRPQPGLYSVPTRGGTLHQITQGACDGDAVVDWSPNGREIAYIGSVRGSDTGALFVVDVLTRRVLRLASRVQDWQAVGSPIFDWPASSELAWSPDSSKIAFAGSPAVETIDIDGTDLRKLAKARSSRAEVLSLSWSPDSSRIAFTVGRRYYERYAGRTRACASFSGVQPSICAP